MTEERLLPYIGALTGEDWGRIRAAKVAMDLPFLVKPVRAVPGSPGRVLAVGVEPSWVWEGAFVADTRSQGLTAALRYVLTGEDDPRGMTVEKWLQGVLGPGVKEIIDERTDEEKWGKRGEVDPNLGDGLRWR